MPAVFSKDALSPSPKMVCDQSPNYLDQLIAQAQAEDLAALGLKTAPSEPTMSVPLCCRPI